MSEIYNSTSDPFPGSPGAKKIPSTLNVLTILTMIGCAIGLIFGITGFTGAQKRYDDMEKVMSDGSMDKMPGFFKNMINEDTLGVLRKSQENRVAILVITLVSIGLCLYGALEMRKLKKQGFYLYTIGELLPVIGTVIFIGVAAFSGFGLLGIIIPLVFLLLYARQLKYMN